MTKHNASSAMGVHQDPEKCRSRKANKDIQARSTDPIWEMIFGRPEDARRKSADDSGVPLAAQMGS
jgi:hypothetical protein